jgi:hypothetical protein
MNDLVRRHELFEQAERGVDDNRLVVELDDKGQVDHEPQDIRGMEGAFAAKAGNPPEHNDAMNTVLVLQNIEHLFHQCFFAAVIAFLDVDADNNDIIGHGKHPYRFRAIKAPLKAAMNPSTTERPRYKTAFM